METTANLQLPYLMPSQAQKRVTHNEALAILDAIVQLAVLHRDLSSPPGAPEEGDRYIVATGATGAWAGQDDKVAVYQDGAWAFLSPRAGWLALIADEGAFFHFTGSAWASVAGAPSPRCKTSPFSASAPRPTRPTRSPRSSTRRCGRPSPPAKGATATCATR